MPATTITTKQQQHRTINPTIIIITIILSALIRSTYLYPSNGSGGGGTTTMRSMCPQLYEKTFRGYAPRGNLSAGTYSDVAGVTQLKDCVVKCCVTADCNVALMDNEKCYHLRCASNERCVPVRSVHAATSSDRVEMVLVKPTDDEDTWENVLAAQASEYSPPNDNFDRDSFIRRLQDIYKDPIGVDDDNDESTYPYSNSLACNVGIDETTCELNEICVPNHGKSRAGTCTCKPGYYRRNSIGMECVLATPSLIRNDDDNNKAVTSNNDDFSSSDDDSIHLTERILLDDTITPHNKTIIPVMTRKHLTVTSVNQEVKLPKNDVTLLAHVEPDDTLEVEKYQFEWTSLEQPDGGSTAVKHQSDGGQLQLSKLSEGLYTFKVSVSNSAAYGETFVNVTVLPPSRINKPPQIIITPANQTIKQPNTAAVLDASSSTDDDGIVSWHWELQQGPVGYQPQIKDSATLQLNDLTKPGNYTFKLTVTDSDKATSSSTANITVLKFTDYPPDANAGPDKIIYLPHNKITLNGNLSSDDHPITTWEWIKSPDDAQKAVDMQDTRTPYLQLSNLQEGMYTFSLKITDSANQSSTAQVHVFVKPPTNKPPIAVAGPNMTISLPQTWIVLDANRSTDDNKIVGYNWEQVEGPSIVQFDNGGHNRSRTNVTGLTKGLYNFKLSVTDDNNNVASDNVYVTVNQNINQKPVANAGDDFEIELPRNVITVNGSGSRDDWAIVKWKWTRNEQSLAIGRIAEKSDESPILILTDIIAAGKYMFNLTVYDEQGLSDTDTVTFYVKNDPKLYDLIEITIDVDAAYLTEIEYNKLCGKLALLVVDGSKLQIRNVRPELGTGKAKITFYVENIDDNKSYPANDIVQYLRQKLRVDASLLGFSVAKLQTTICQNNCSGHGVCDEITRLCECEAFWMRDMFKVYLKSDEDSDCSWSILYVVLGVVCSILGFIGSMWTLVYLCYSWCAKRRAVSKPTNIYKLIENTDDHMPAFASRKSGGGGSIGGGGNNNMSDSDTDSDVVFESARTKNHLGRFSDGIRNGHSKSNGGGGSGGRNGFSKMGRRLKT